MSIIDLEKIESVMGVNIEDVGFPPETTACLKRENVIAVGDLLRMDYDKLEYLDSVGLLSIDAIKECLKTYVDNTESQEEQSEDSGNTIDLEELLDTSILDLDLNIKAYYALRFARLDTIRQIIIQDKRSLKRNHKRIKDEMIGDIDKCIRSFASDHNCMEEMLAFPFFDEEPEEEETVAEKNIDKPNKPIDVRKEIARYTETILISRSRQNKPWITAAAIMDALRSDYPEIGEIATAEMVREILSKADWVEKDDFYYRYKFGTHYIPEEQTDIETEKPAEEITEQITTQEEEMPDQTESDGTWTDESLEARYREKYYLTKELLRSECDNDQKWYTATKVCAMLSERYPAVMKGSMYSIIRRVLINASWAEASEGGLRFRWKPEVRQEEIEEEPDKPEADETDNDTELTAPDPVESEDIDEDISTITSSAPEIDEQDPQEPTDNTAEEESGSDEDDDFGLLNIYRNSYDPLDSHRRDLCVNYRTYHALRLSGLETIREIVSMDKKTLKRDYPRIDDGMIADLEKAIIRLVSAYDFEEQVRKYPFFSDDVKKAADDPIESTDVEDEQHTQFESEFINWLTHVRHFSEEQCTDIITTMREVEQYSRENGYIRGKLYDLESTELEALKDGLSFNGEFLIKINGKINRYFLPINELRLYKKSIDQPLESDDQYEPDTASETSYEDSINESEDRSDDIAEIPSELSETEIKDNDATLDVLPEPDDAEEGDETEQRVDTDIDEMSLEDNVSDDEETESEDDSEVETDITEEAEEVVPVEPQDPYELVRCTSINSLGLPSTAYRPLQRAGITTLGEILDSTKEELLSHSGLGYSALHDIIFAAKYALIRAGISLFDVECELFNTKQTVSDTSNTEPFDPDASEDNNTNNESETDETELPETETIAEQLSGGFGETESEPSVSDSTESANERIKDLSVSEIGLSNRARNCLLKANINTVRELIGKTREELMAIPNMGSGSMRDIETRLGTLLQQDVWADDHAEDSAPVLPKKPVLESDDEIFFEIPISELQLSNRSYNGLMRCGITVVGQLHDYSESDLYQIKGMGEGSVSEIIEAVTRLAEKPLYKFATLDNAEKFGEDFYASEEFSSIVEDKVHDLFASKENNSMSLFEIWSELGSQIPEETVKGELDKLVDKGLISFSDETYHFEYPSIIDAIEVLPGKYRDVISLKLQGLKYAEIAERYGVTRSWVQQVAAKGMTAVFRGAKGIAPVRRVKEDDYRELFQNYSISLDEWTIFLKKPELAYRYLAMRYKKGEKPLPGVKQVSIPARESAPPKETPTPKESGAPKARPKAEKKIDTINGTIEDLLDYYKSLAMVQRDVVLYSDEEQYTKEITKLCKRINREIKRKKYISDIRITEQEYLMLKGYLHYAVKILDKTGIAPDEAMFATAVVNVAERVYDGNMWGNFFKEIGIKQTQRSQSSVGGTFINVLEKHDLLKADDGGYFQNIMMHCFVSNKFADSYFEFLFNFYRIDLERDIEGLDRDTMRALMDSICSEENVGRTYMLAQHIGQAMAANRRGATIRIRNHMKLLDKFFWDDSFEINTTHRLNNLMQKWARSSKEVIGEMEAFSTGRTRGRKRFAAPYIAYDESSRSCVLVIPAQSIKRIEDAEIYWKVSGSINEEFDVELAESVIGYKVLESRWEIPMEVALDAMQLELMTSEGEVIKKFQIRGADVRFFDSEGYPINSKGIKVGEVVSISREDSPVKSSALYETEVIDGMLLSSFHFEFEDLLHLPNGHIVIVGRPEITNTIAGKGRIEGAACHYDDRDYDLYGKMPYLVLRMKSDKFPGTAVMINGKRHRLSDLEFESFSLDDRSDDRGYYIDLNNYLEQKNDVYRIAVDIPGGASPHWEFVYIEGFEVDFDEAPYVFEPRGTVAFPNHITIKEIEEGCDREPGINGYKFVINEVGRTLDFVTEIGDKDVDVSITIPAFFIKDENGDWDCDMPAPVWHADLPDVIDLAVPHHKITLYMDDVFTESGDSERKIEYRKNLGDDHILCDISKFKSYLSGDDFARQLRMRFGDVDSNLLTIIIHSKVISLQIIGNFETNELAVNADISGKATYYVDIRRGEEIIAEKLPLIDGTARINHEIANGVYEVEVFELVEDESGFGGEDYYSIGAYNQEMINPYDMTGRSFKIIQIEEKDDPSNVLPLRLRFNVLDLKGTDDKHIYKGMMLVKKSFYHGSELAAFPVTVRFEDLNRPNFAWVSFVDEYGDDTDFLYDTRKQGILQEENMYLKPMVCYRRYTVLNEDEHVYHIDFIDEHYSSDYDGLDDMIEYPESDTKIVFKNHKYDSKRKRYETNDRAGRGNIHFSSSLVFVGDAPLSAKSKMLLRDARIQTLNDLTKITKADLARRSSMTVTVKMIREIESVLAQYGMAFKQTEGE